MYYALLKKIDARYKPPMRKLLGELLTFEKKDVLGNIELGRSVAESGPVQTVMCGDCEDDH